MRKTRNKKEDRRRDILQEAETSKVSSPEKETLRVRLEKWLLSRIAIWEEAAKSKVSSPEEETLIVRLQKWGLSMLVLLFVKSVLLDDHHYEVEFLSRGEWVNASVITWACGIGVLLTIGLSKSKEKILAAASYGLAMTLVYIPVTTWLEKQKDIDGIVLKNPWIKIRYKMDVSEAKNYVLTKLYPGTSEILEKLGKTPEERRAIEKEIVESLPYEEMKTIRGCIEAYYEKLAEIFPSIGEIVWESLSGPIVTHPWAVAAVAAVVFIVGVVFLK